MKNNSKILSNVRIIQKCIIVSRDGKVLTLKRAADDRSRGGSWDLPGGGYEQGEFVLDAIKREVSEESGLTVSSLSPIYVTNQIDVKVGFFQGSNVFGICYVSRNWSGEVQLSEEHTEYRWVSPEELLTYSFGEDGRFFVSSIKAFLNI